MPCSRHRGGVPWFPDFANAAELARRSTRATGRADPVARYLAALAEGDVHDLTTTWPGGVSVHDPRAGEIHTPHRLRRFIQDNQHWLAERGAHIETVASTAAGGRAVVELSAHLTADDHQVAWPVAVVAESVDPMSVVFRTYCSQTPVDGHRHVRPPLLPPAPLQLTGAVGRHLAALGSGDIDALVDTFAAHAYVQEAIGPPHRGPDEIRALYTAQFGGSGGMGLHPSLVTDDGQRCAIEYSCDAWGDRPLPPQAGLIVYERDSEDRLAAARMYDDIEMPLLAS